MVDPLVVATVDLYVTCSRTVEIKIRNRIYVRRVYSYSKTQRMVWPVQEIAACRKFPGGVGDFRGGVSPRKHAWLKRWIQFFFFRPLSLKPTFIIFAFPNLYCIQSQCILITAELRGIQRKNTWRSRSVTSCRLYTSLRLGQYHGYKLSYNHGQYAGE